MGYLDLPEMVARGIVAVGLAAIVVLAVRAVLQLFRRTR